MFKIVFDPLFERLWSSSATDDHTDYHGRGLKNGYRDPFSKGFVNIHLSKSSSLLFSFYFEQQNKTVLELRPNF